VQLFVNVSPDGLVEHATEADQDISMMSTESQPAAMTGTLQHLIASVESDQAQAHAGPDMEGNDMDGDKEILENSVQNKTNKAPNKGYSQ